MGVKTFFTSPIKRWLKAFIGRSPRAQWLFRRMLTSDYATRTLLNDNAAIIDLLTHPHFRKMESYPVIEQFVFEHALTNPNTRDRVLEWINTQAALVKHVTRNTQLKKISQSEPEFLSLLIKHHDLYEDLVSRDVLEQVFKYEETLDCILENYVLRDRLLFDDRVIGRMVVDDRFHERLLDDPELCLYLLLDQRTINALLESPEAMDSLFSQPELIESLKRSSTAIDLILSRLDKAQLLEYLDDADLLDRLDAEALLNHLIPEQMLEHLGTDVIAAHLTPQQMLEYLETDTILEHLTTAQLVRHLGAKPMLEHLTAEQMLSHLGDDILLSHLNPQQMIAHLGVETLLSHLNPQQMLEHLGTDVILSYLTPDQMLDYLGPEALLQRLSADAMLAHLGPDAMLDYLGDDELLNRLSPEKMLASIDVTEILNHLSPNQMLDFLGTEKLLAHLDDQALLNHLTPQQKLESLDEDVLLKHIGDDRMVQHLGPDKLFAALQPSDIAERVKVGDLLAEIDPNGAQIAEYIGKHPRILPAISRDEFALAEFLKSHEIRQKLRLLDGLRRLSELEYSLPAAVVSYPRSGSNFMQSILRHSSGMHNVSIYGPDPANRDPLLTLKSHALSPAYLEDEYERFVGPGELPGRIILLKRDPRDVMISFYEFTQRQRKTSIAQEDFLENISFFYASTIDKNHTRKLDTGPMSVVEAYKKHIREWFTERPKSLDVFEVRYEDLVHDPLRHFRDALDYLELDVSVAKAYLGIRVSLYSDETRPRAIAQGWKQSGNQYDTIIQKVETLLADELKLLGYADEAPSSDSASSRSSAQDSKPASTSKSRPKSKPKSKKAKNTRKRSGVSASKNKNNSSQQKKKNS